MRIDKQRFLELAVLVAAGGCDRAASQPAPVVPVQLPPVAPSASASAPPSASASALPPAPLCDNAKGSPRSVCDRVGPACEGLHEECVSLDEDLRPRVAEAFAECFAQQKASRCRDRALGACMRKAIEGACVEPGTTERCRGIMAKCEAAGRRPKYTLEQCERVLSATLPQGPGKWQEVDEERLGPSMAEGCSLTYALPYQPWGPSFR